MEVWEHVRDTSHQQLRDGEGCGERGGGRKGGRSGMDVCMCEGSEDRSDVCVCVCVFVIHVDETHCMQTLVR